MKYKIQSCFTCGKRVHGVKIIPTMKRRVGRVVKNNGKNTDKQLKKLVNDRLVLRLKQGRTYSLNHLYMQTIEQRLIAAEFPV